MSNNFILPWIEKYRPNKLDEIIDEGDKVPILKGLIERDELPHLLFYGPPGTGKTSLILASAREYYGENFRRYVLELNASDDRGIDTVRKQIPEFVKTLTNRLKLIILDEADALTNDAQGALRRVVEQFSKYCRFCLICNNIYKIIPGLLSRCVVIRFGKLPEANCRQKLNSIIAQEQVNISSDTIKFILQHCSDFRQVLNILQLEHTRKSTLGGDGYSAISNEDICRYLGIPSKDKFNQIMKNLLNERLKVNVMQLQEDYNQNLYSLVELVKMLTSWTVEQKYLTIGQKRKIIESLSELDFRLKNSTGESDIQLNALASIFLGLGQIIQDRAKAELSKTKSITENPTATTTEKETTTTTVTAKDTTVVTTATVKTKAKDTITATATAAAAATTKDTTATTVKTKAKDTITATATATATATTATAKATTATAAVKDTTATTVKTKAKDTIVATATATANDKETSAPSNTTTAISSAATKDTPSSQISSLVVSKVRKTSTPVTKVSDEVKTTGGIKKPSSIV